MIYRWCELNGSAPVSVRFKAANIFDAYGNPTARAFPQSTQLGAAARRSTLGRLRQQSLRQRFHRQGVRHRIAWSGTRGNIDIPGDSVGPTFIQGKFTDVASYITRLATPLKNPDFDVIKKSSFGEIIVC